MGGTDLRACSRCYKVKYCSRVLNRCTLLGCDPTTSRRSTVPTLAQYTVISWLLGIYLGKEDHP